MNIDWAILYWIQDNIRCGFLDVIVPRITMLGNGGCIWLMIAGVMICTKKYRKQGILLLAGLLMGLLIGNLFLKHLVCRSRPCWLDHSINLLIATPKDYSFPSGHTLSSVIGATILTQTNRKFGWGAIPLAGLIACSRLYLFVHFPSDVFASILLGILIGEIAFRFGSKIIKKQASSDA